MENQKLLGMDQRTAQRLYKEGAIFLFLDVPEGTEFGIDMKSWNTGEKFRGVKMIPPGIHYIFYSSVSSTGDTAPRTGFYYNFKSGEVVARKWDKLNDDISNDNVDEGEIVSLKDNLFALDQFLGCYPYDILQRWNKLTSHIHLDLMERLMPLSGKIKSALELVSFKDSDRPRGGNAESPSTSQPKRRRIIKSDFLLDDILMDMKPQPGSEIRFTEIPEKYIPDYATPTQEPTYAECLAYALERLQECYPAEMDLLGELQFAYICFLVGHSFEAFEQWKKIVVLLCSCDEAIIERVKLYDGFITVLEPQIKEIPKEFLADIVTNTNFVYVKLRDFFRSVKLNGNDVNEKIRGKAEQFQKRLTNMYSWDFTHLESEDEEDAPVIVETE